MAAPRVHLPSTVVADPHLRGLPTTSVGFAGPSGERRVNRIVWLMRQNVGDSPGGGGERMDRRTGGRTDGRADGWTGRRAGGRAGGCERVKGRPARGRASVRNGERVLIEGNGSVMEG